MTSVGGGPAGPEQEPDGSAEREPVGSVGEEAAKLLGALSDWAREQGGEYASAAAGAASGFAHAVEDVNEHLATGGEDCRYCPACRVIRVVRGTSPEVREHLSAAAGSLLQAAASLMSTHPPASTSSSGAGHGPGVERIDLDDAEAAPWADGFPAE